MPLSTYSKTLLTAVLGSTVMLSGTASGTGVLHAANGIKLIVDGKLLNPGVAPASVHGTTMVPVRAVAEAMGAQVSWDGANNAVEIQSPETAKSDQRIRQLESALAATTPEEAVKRYADGVKTRNGALQFAVMTPELQNRLRASYVSLNWVTGTSSPWVERYTYDGAQVSGTEWRYTIQYIYTSSTQEKVAGTEDVTVVNRNGQWQISGNGATLDKQPLALQNQAAHLLVQNALDAYWHVLGGGQQTDGAAVKTFSLNGKEYRYLGGDIDTQEKLSLYLDSYYTEAVAKSIQSEAGIIEHNGRLAQPNADGGTLMNLSSRLPVEVTASTESAAYEFKFEIGDSGNSVPVRISFKNANGWKLDTAPSTIYQAGNGA